jgi:hypothetical protein
VFAAESLPGLRFADTAARLLLRAVVIKFRGKDSHELFLGAFFLYKI